MEYNTELYIVVAKGGPLDGTMCQGPKRLHTASTLAIVSARTKVTISSFQLWPQEV